MSNTAPTFRAMEAAHKIIGFSGSPSWINKDGTPDTKAQAYIAQIIDREVGEHSPLAKIKRYLEAYQRGEISAEGAASYSLSALNEGQG